MVCGAHIKTGSQNTFIGGPTERVAFVLDLEEWLHTGLEAPSQPAACCWRRWPGSRRWLEWSPSAA